MTEEIFLQMILCYVSLNFILFIVNQFTENMNLLHKIISVFNTVLFVALLTYGFWRLNHLFVIFVPIILLFGYPIALGLNEELSDEDVASAVVFYTKSFIKKETRNEIKLLFVHFLSFPFYYLLKSWRKK